MFRDLIPARARRPIYLVLAVAVVVGQVLDLPVVAELAVGLGALFGFSLAAGNVNDDDA